jgi:hypothetical protein
MKKILLFAAVLYGASAVNAQTITSDDLKWTVNNTWPGSLYAETGSGLDLTAGTGKAWDLTAYTSGTLDTIFALAPTNSGTADIKINSTLLGELDYKNTGTDWALAGALVSGLGFTAVNDHNAVMGLPHTQGGTSSSSTAAGAPPFSFTIDVAIDVVSSGTVTTAFGSFAAVLVKETISGAYNREAYYVETVEYGRVGVFVAGNNQIWVTESPIEVGASEVEGSSSLSVYPNPASSVVTVSSSNAGAIAVYDALGNVVSQTLFNGGSTTFNAANLGSGLYVVQLTTSAGVETATVIVK